MATKVLIDDMLTDEELAAISEEDDSTDKPEKEPEEKGATKDDGDENDDAEEEDTSDDEEDDADAEEEEVDEDSEEEDTEEEEVDEDAEEDDSDESGDETDETDEPDETEEEDTADDNKDSLDAELEAATLFELADPVVSVAVPKVEEIEANEDKIAELIEARDKLNAQVEEGEIEQVEYTKKYTAISDELNKIHTEVAVMRSQAEQAEKLIAAQWEADATAFIKANPVFDIKKNPALFGALNANIQEIANSDGVESMSNQDILREAAKRVHEQLSSIMPKKEKNVATKTKTSKKAKSAKKKQVASAKSKKTLTNAPSAAPNSDKGEFAYLDKLEGAELEEAIAKLSPSKLNKYLAV